MLTLYQFEISPFCDKIRRALRAKKLPFRVEEIPLSQSLWRARRLSPAAKLPCLAHEGELIADSTDIAHWLEERFPDPPLLPRDPAQRALCHVLEDWADESLYFYEMRLRFTLPHNARRFLPALTAHDPGWMKAAAALLVPRMMRGVLSKQGVGRKPLAAVLRDVERHVAAIEGLLGGREWLVGGALTLADLAVFAQLDCIRAADEGAALVASRPSVADWMARVDAATAGT